MSTTGTSQAGGLRPARRTLVKGAAWAVPAIAVAAPAAHAATSDVVPPPPSVAWGNACATTGNGEGCAGLEKALQVPVTIKNTTANDLIFVVKRGWSTNGSTTPPTTAPVGTGGNGSGHSFWSFGQNPSTCGSLTPPTNCTTLTTPLIASTASQVLLTPGQMLTLWYQFKGTNGNASDFTGKIWYAWYDPVTCAKVEDSDGFSERATAIPNNNCHSVPNPTGEKSSELTKTVEDTPTEVVEPQAPAAKTTVQDSSKASDAQPTTPPEPTGDDSAPTEDTAEVTASPDTASTDVETTENN